MSVLLDIHDQRDGDRQRVFIRDGQAVTFGRDTWNDVTLADETIAERHFTISCQPEAVFQVLPDAAELQLNEEPNSDGRLKTNDVLSIGTFQLRVLKVTASHAAEIDAESSVGESASAADLSEAITTSELVAGCRLTADQEQCFSSEPDPFACLDGCIADGDVNSAAMILLGLMTEMQRIDWLLPLCTGVSSVCSGVAAEAVIERLHEFRQQPSEPLRRELNETARKTSKQNPWRWLLCMVYWAGESLGPPDVEPIPPAGHLPIVAGMQVLQLLPIPAITKPDDTRITWIGEGQTILQSSSSANVVKSDSSDSAEQLAYSV